MVSGTELAGGSLHHRWMTLCMLDPAGCGGVYVRCSPSCFANKSFLPSQPSSSPQPLHPEPATSPQKTPRPPPVSEPTPAGDASDSSPSPPSCGGSSIAPNNAHPFLPPSKTDEPSLNKNSRKGDPTRLIYGLLRCPDVAPRTELVAWPISAASGQRDLPTGARQTGGRGRCRFEHHAAWQTFDVGGSGPTATVDSRSRDRARLLDSDCPDCSNAPQCAKCSRSTR